MYYKGVHIASGITAGAFYICTVYKTHIKQSALHIFITVYAADKACLTGRKFA